MRPTGSPKELERRRMRALDLLNKGKGPSEVARTVGAHRRTVQRWASRVAEGGRPALRAKPHPGRVPKLAVSQRDRLTRVLLEGAKAQGFGTDLWTGPRVAQVVHRLFGVRYHPRYIPRLLRALGWTPQKPEGRAYERDERAIARWKREDWARIKGGRRADEPT